MKARSWDPEHERVVRALESRLAKKEGCIEVIDAYDGLLQSVFGFTSQLLGHAGARAVLARSIQLASRRAALIRQVRIGPDAVDFGDLRQLAAREGCTSAALMEDLLELGVMIFRTLSELAGEVLTEPMIRRLEED